jgi:hypothetical protein
MDVGMSDAMKTEPLPECEACLKARADGAHGALYCDSDADKCRNNVQGKTAKIEAEQS